MKNTHREQWRVAQKECMGKMTNIPTSNGKRRVEMNDTNFNYHFYVHPMLFVSLKMHGKTNGAVMLRDF